MSSRNTPFLKQISQLLSVTLALAQAGPAHSASPPNSPPIIDVTGKLNPKFSVKLNPDDVVKLLQELKGLNQLPTRTLDINDLMRDGDEEAIQLASSAISDSFLETAKDLLNLKAMAYKLAALVSIEDTVATRSELRSVYANQFQTVYDAMIKRLGSPNEAIISAMMKCKSELCAAKIFAAQLDIISLAEAMNVGINANTGVDILAAAEETRTAPSTLTKSSKTKSSKSRKAKNIGESVELRKPDKESKPTKSEFRFQSPLVNFALEQTHQELQNQINDPSGFALMLSTVLTPFILTARTVSNILTEIDRCLNTPQLQEYTLRAFPVSVAFYASIQTSRSIMKQVAQSIVSGIPLGRLSPFYGVWILGGKKIWNFVIKPENESSHFKSKVSYNFAGDWEHKGDSYLIPGRLMINYGYTDNPGGMAYLWLMVEPTRNPDKLKVTYPVYFEPLTGTITIPKSNSVTDELTRFAD